MRVQTTQCVNCRPLGEVFLMLHVARLIIAQQIGADFDCSCGRKPALVQLPILGGVKFALTNDWRVGEVVA
jgi:hypothetical protein